MLGCELARSRRFLVQELVQEHGAVGFRIRRAAAEQARRA